MIRTVWCLRLSGAAYLWTVAGTRLPETLSTSSRRHIISWQDCGGLLCAYHSEMLQQSPHTTSQCPGIVCGLHPQSYCVIVHGCPGKLRINPPSLLLQECMLLSSSAQASRAPRTMCADMGCKSDRCISSACLPMEQPT